MECFEIISPAVQWYFCRKGGGLAGLVDAEGRDWLSFHREGKGPRGEYRGFPNAVHRQNTAGALHPLNAGTTPAHSRVSRHAPDRVVVEVTVESWKARYSFYDSFCAFRMESVPEACRYWVLYEGTPGGSETPEEVEFLLPDGAWTPAAAPWTGPLPAAAWIAFRSIRSPRAILLAAPPGLPVLSSSWWMDSMTVCGLGRDPGDIRNKAYAAPGTFLLGLAESQDPELLATRAEAWRALEGAKDD